MVKLFCISDPQAEFGKFATNGLIASGVVSVPSNGSRSGPSGCRGLYDKARFREAEGLPEKLSCA